MVPGIHVFARKTKTWMAGTSPARTPGKSALYENAPRILLVEKIAAER
jgi:hypothetical protein